MTTNDAPSPAPLNPTNPTLRIALAAELASPNRQQLKMRVIDAIAEGVTHVVLDARDCGYIDGAGIGVLVSIAKKCVDAGGSLEIESLSDELREYFRILKLDTQFVFTAPESAA